MGFCFSLIFVALYSTPPLHVFQKQSDVLRYHEPKMHFDAANRFHLNHLIHSMCY